MSDSKPDTAGLKRLERVVAVEPEYYLSYACRAVILIVQNRFEEALIELDRFILPDRRSWDGYFWKGMALAYLDREGEAVEALEKALQFKMSPALLRPLNWLKKDKEVFYQKYGLGLLTRYKLI
jgi:tetratricopeptide (TPR) repeat protein